MTRHIFSTSAPQKREILLMLTWECQTCIHSVWHSFGFVGHWHGQVLSSKYDEGCFSTASSILSSPSNIISSHSIGAELKRANFLLLPTIQAEPSHHWQILHSQHCTVLLLLYSALICSSFNFCILLERLTQPRLTLNQEYPSYLLNANKRQ